MLVTRTLLRWFHSVTNGRRELTGPDKHPLARAFALLLCLSFTSSTVVTASLLDEALEHLRQRKAYLEGAVEPKTAPSRGFDQDLLGLAVLFEVLDFVEERANTLNYGYLAHKNPQLLPTNIHEVLKANAGVCGNQVALFLRLARGLGIEARSAQFYYLDSNGLPVSHIAAQAMLGGKWRFVDVTWQSVFRRLDDSRVDLGVAQLLTLEEINSVSYEDLDIVRDRIDGTQLFQSLYHNSEFGFFEYLFADYIPGGVVSGLEGVVSPFVVTEVADGLTVRPDGIPNYIGASRDHGDGGAVGSMSLALGAPTGSSTLEIDLGPDVCEAPGVPDIAVRDMHTGTLMGTLSASNNRLTFPPILGTEGNRILLSLHDQKLAKQWDRICYQLWKKIRILR